MQFLCPEWARRPSFAEVLVPALPPTTIPTGSSLRAFKHRLIGHILHSILRFCGPPKWFFKNLRTLRFTFGLKFSISWQTHAVAYPHYGILRNSFAAPEHPELCLLDLPPSTLDTWQHRPFRVCGRSPFPECPFLGTPPPAPSPDSFLPRMSVQDPSLSLLVARYLISSHCGTTFHAVNAPQFAYLYTPWRTSRLPSVFGHYDRRCCQSVDFCIDPKMLSVYL